ncbi:hypothetical protein [Veillonella criceti]|uniref:Preprotein translocase subunit SecG n=1 Tax=Veillonella criceti TaxID=103891 RepID=A0A380NLS5_9FIRM|nr:hypothetical protein [Veillonella criceti]SUP42503.1 Uncharacterised protein [Veillonella criceti]
MNKTSDNMEKRIRSVKTWLDKAEQAYADDSTTKGQLQLMLAKAEMQHLDEKQTVTWWQRIGYWPLVMGVLIVLGGTYFAWQGTGASVLPNTTSVERKQELEPAFSDTSNTVTTIGSPSDSDKDITNDSVTNSSANTTTTVKAIPTVDSDNVTHPIVTSEVESSQPVIESNQVDSPSTVANSTYEASASTATVNTQTNETVTTPVISTTQIQEAVREGGRSLRGQE